MDFERRLLHLAQRQHALVARWQLPTIGASETAVRHLFDDPPRWRPIPDQVIGLRGAPSTDGQAALAAVFDAGRGARLSHLSGGMWWGLSCSLTPHHVVTTSASRRKTALARIHRVRVLPDTWTTTLRGIPVVRPELLALQIHAVCPEERAEALVERLWSLRLLSGRSLAAFLSQQGERGRNGTAGLRRYLDERGLDYQPTASNLETRTMQVLRRSGIPVRRQVDSGGESWTGRVDFRHEWLPLVIEVQSAMYHEALRYKREDARRLAKLKADKFVVVEITDDEVFQRPWEAVERVRAKIVEAELVL